MDGGPVDDLAGTPVGAFIGLACWIGLGCDEAGRPTWPGARLPQSLALTGERLSRNSAGNLCTAEVMVWLVSAILRVVISHSQGNQI